MFKFLKKKLKVFEKQLEDEIETELQKESVEEKISEPEKTSDVDEKQTQKSDETKDSSTATEEQKKKHVISAPPKTDESIEDIEPTTPVVQTRKRARKQISEEKKQREKHIVEQIQQNIENELNRIVQTRKSIEDAIKTDEKPTRILDEKKIDDLLWDLEVGLLESDVENEIRHTSFARLRSSDFVENILKNAISHVLTANDFDFFEFIKNTKKPIVIMFIGVNGTGKTLSIAKIAHTAGDTFRAGAIEQLGIHAENVGVKIVKHGPNSDPAAVAYDAIEHAKAKHKDVVLLDTAGRMQTNINLMDEMEKIKRVAKPDLIIFVGDALSGNDAVEQAKRFNETVGIDGVILTKVDTDAKGGSSLSIAYTIGKPLLFVGIGQNYEDQIPFDAQWMVDNLFGKEE